jgi:hypothetical protein
VALVWLDGGLMDYLWYDKDSLRLLERRSNTIAEQYLRTLVTVEVLSLVLLDSSALVLSLWS